MIATKPFRIVATETYTTEVHRYPADSGWNATFIQILDGDEFDVQIGKEFVRLSWERLGKTIWVDISHESWNWLPCRVI